MKSTLAAGSSTTACITVDTICDGRDDGSVADANATRARLAAKAQKAGTA